MEAIRRAGLRFETNESDERVRLQASTEPQAVRTAELVLFCVKSQAAFKGEAMTQDEIQAEIDAVRAPPRRARSHPAQRGVYLGGCNDSREPRRARRSARYAGCQQSCRQFRTAINTVVSARLWKGG